MTTATVAHAPVRIAARISTAQLTVTVALVTACVGYFVTIGADARWLAALGGIIVARGGVPTGVPFAAASTVHWANSLVLAELIFHWLEALGGDKAIAVANLLAVAAGLGIVAADARAGGARAPKVCGGIALAAIGAFPMLGVARIQMFSIVLFPAVVALLRSEQRNPSRRIWLVLPVLALWSNLHGAAIAGLAVVFCYLALCRLRSDPLTALGVAIGAVVAMCVTPAGIRTIDYYHGLLTNVAAQQGVGQWAPLGQSAFDWVMIAAILLLAIQIRHRRPALWEIAVTIGLAVLTVKAARDGIWLLLFMVGLTASRTEQSESRDRDWAGLIPVGAVAAVALLALDIAGAPRPAGASQQMVSRAVQLAGGAPILADGLPSEQVALAGGKVWAGNPLDAFSRRVQTQYVDFIQGEPGGDAALSAHGVRFVLVTRGSAAAALTAQDHSYSEVASDSSAIFYERR
jgi:hypothetical protein